MIPITEPTVVDYLSGDSKFVLFPATLFFHDENDIDYYDFKDVEIQIDVDTLYKLFKIVYDNTELCKFKEF